MIKTGFIVSGIFIIMGPTGWINLGLIAIFNKTYIKKPELTLSITFIVSLLICLGLLILIY